VCCQEAGEAGGSLCRGQASAEEVRCLSGECGLIGMQEALLVPEESLLQSNRGDTKMKKTLHSLRIQQWN